MGGMAYVTGQLKEATAVPHLQKTLTDSLCSDQAACTAMHVAEPWLHHCICWHAYLGDCRSNSLKQQARHAQQHQLVCKVGNGRQQTVLVASPQHLLQVVQAMLNSKSDYKEEYDEESNCPRRCFKNATLLSFHDA